MRAIALALSAAAVAALTSSAESAGAVAHTSVPRWQVFATHVPALNAVDARSSSDVWAAGNGIVHWDGRHLDVVPLRWKNAELNGISAVSASDVWAVGNLHSGKLPHARWAPLAVHWDGRSWRRVGLPRIGSRYASLEDVVALASNDAWAVGDLGARPLLLHWDGRRWRRVDVQRFAPALGMLHAIAGRNPNDVWAAGMQGNIGEESYGYTDYVLHWDGHAWRREISPLEAEEGSGPYANAVDVGFNGDVWTLNYDFSGNGPSFVRWSGQPRSAHASDWLSDDSYNDIAVISATDAWIAGISDSNPGHPAEGPLIAHWDGARWKVAHTRFERYANVLLYAISAASADDIWAVGNHLIVRYD